MINNTPLTCDNVLLLMMVQKKIYCQVQRWQFYSTDEPLNKYRCYS